MKIATEPSHFRAITYPTFLDGQTKRMLIGNQWVDLAPGKTVDSINEATAEVLANVAAGDAEDINLCGYKMSGYGRESGLQQFDEYLNVKAVWIKTG